MCHSSHFDAFFQSKSTKCENFGCLLNPLIKKKKGHFVQGKGVWKGLKICTYGFLGMLISMNYVRSLCDKYFLSYDGFSWFLTERSRYRVLKHGVGVEWDPRKYCCIGPIPFWWFFTPFYATCLLKFWFSGTAYHRDLKPVPLDLACLKP